MDVPIARMMQNSPLDHTKLFGYIIFFKSTIQNDDVFTKKKIDKEPSIINVSSEG